MTSRPAVGVAVIVVKDGRVLLGKRKNAHGAGTWALPGGHLEFNEAIEACARREVLEETGLHIQNIRNAAFTNDVFIEEQKHYVTLFVTAEYHHGDLDLREPQKCERWEWFRWDELPKPRFLPLENLLHQGIKIELGTRKPLVGGRGRESRPGTGQGVAGPGTGPARKGRG